MELKRLKQTMKPQGLRQRNPQKLTDNRTTEAPAEDGTTGAAAEDGTTGAAEEEPTDAVADEPTEAAAAGAVVADRTTVEGTAVDFEPKMAVAADNETKVEGGAEAGEEPGKVAATDLELTRCLEFTRGLGSCWKVGDDFKNSAKKCYYKFVYPDIYSKFLTLWS